MPSRTAKLICASVLLTLMTTVFAHTSAIETSPKSGSILVRSPATIEITFAEAARLTSVVVAQAGKPERKLAFAPTHSATTFRIEDPALEPGRNEVRWIALSKDGHVVKGTIVLTIQADATTP